MTTDVFDRSDWWDEDGFAFGLHELLNPVRIPYFNEMLPPEAESILDDGCGGGYVAAGLASRAVSVVGLDVSLAAVSAAGASVRGAAFLAGDAHRLPFADEVFDAVILSEVLEHLDRPEVVMAEAARVLKPGGSLLVTGPNRTLVSRIVLIWFAQEWPTRVLPRGLHEYRKFLRPAELHQLGGRLGLNPVDLTGLGMSLGGVLSSVKALISLKRRSITYGQAAERVEVVRSRFISVAYMATMRKACIAND